MELCIDISQNKLWIHSKFKISLFPR